MESEIKVMSPHGGESSLLPESSKNEAEKIEKICSYCKKKVIDCVTCYKCEKYFHKSCVSRVKDLKMFTQEIGLCCYVEDGDENLHLFMRLFKEIESKNREIAVLQRLNGE